MVEGGGEQRRALRNFVIPGVQGIALSIAHPNVEANNFELKLAVIFMVQQSQSGDILLEDPNLHLSIFLKVYDTLKPHRVPTNAIRLQLFSFSLRDKARAWLTRAFLDKFFSPSNH